MVIEFKWPIPFNQKSKSVKVKFLLSKLKKHKIAFSIPTKAQKNIALFILIPRIFEVVCFRRVAYLNEKLDKLMLFLFF